MDTRRWLSLLLAVCMIVGMVPGQVFAAETEAPVTVKPVTDNVNEVKNPVEDVAEPQSDTEYPALEPNMELAGEITTGGEYVYYSVTPEVSCYYAFSSQSEYDTYGYLYDANMTQLTSDDDSGGDRQFLIRYNLEAGVTYILGVRFYNSSYTGAFTVKMRHAEYDVEIIEQAAVCGEASTHLCTCWSCGAEWYEYPVNEHSYWSEWQEPTCTEAGGYTYTCNNCGHSYFEEVAAYGHSYDAGICWRCGDAPVQSGTCGDDITWSLDPAEGVLRLEGSGAMYDYGWYNTPWYEYKDNITKIEIGEGITSVGSSAFIYSYDLTEVVLPSTLESIGESAFYHCSAMTTIQLPEGLTSIGYDAFCECTKLESLVLPDTLVELGDGAFRYSGLKEITIPGSLTVVPTNAFNSCKKLETVVIEEGVTSIGYASFMYCEKLVNLTLPSTMEMLSGQAFDRCSSLQSVTLPEGLTDLGYMTFANCDLRTVTIPSTVIGWSQDCFDANWNLTEIHVAAGNTVLASSNGLVYSADMTVLRIIPSGLKTVTVASTVTEMSAHLNWKVQSIIFQGDVPNYWYSYVENENNITIYYQPGSNWTSSTMADNFGYAGFRVLPLTDGAILSVNDPVEVYSFENVELYADIYGDYSGITWYMSDDGGESWVGFASENPFVTPVASWTNGILIYAEVTTAEGVTYTSNTFLVTVYPGVVMDGPGAATLNVLGNSEAFWFFTPAESGYYRIIHNSDSYVDRGVYADDTYVYSGNNGLYYLEAGQEYKIQVQNYYEEDTAVEVVIEPTVQVNAGETFTITVNGDDGYDTVVYQVNVSESGYYEVFGISSSFFRYENESIESSNWSGIYWLEAGEDYFMSFYEMDYPNDDYAVAIRQPLTLGVGDSVTETIYNGSAHYFFVPEVSGLYYFGGSNPELSYNYSTSSDNGMEHITDGWYRLEAGEEYMLTVNCYSNKSTYTIRVKAMSQVEIGHSETLNMGEQESVGWEFVPETSGVYFIESQNTSTDYWGGFRIQVWNEENGWQNFGGGKRMVNLTAGETYYVFFQNTSGSELTDVVLSLSAPDEFTLGAEYSVDYEANGKHIYFSFTPDESGFYTFNYQYDLSVSLNGEYVESRNTYSTQNGRVMAIYLEAGNTYSLDFYSYQSGQSLIFGDPVNALAHNDETIASHGYHDKYFAEITVEEAGCYTLLTNNFTVGGAPNYFELWDTAFSSIGNHGEGYDDDWNTNRRWVVANLEPGKYLVVAYRDWDSFEGSLFFTPAAEPESIDAYDMVMIPGQTELVSLYPRMEDGGPCDTTMTFQVSDPAIANVMDSGDGYYVEAYAPGTVTITGTTINGISATITVTVKDPIPLTFGTPATITVTPGQMEAFTFTAESEGWYGFLVTSGCSYEMELNGSWDGWYDKEIDGVSYRYTYLYNPGTYILTVEAYDNNEIEGEEISYELNVTVNPCVEPNEIILPETMTVFTENYYTLNPSFDTPWVWTYLDWTCTAENNEGYVTSYYYSECTFYAQNEGTMTFTASFTKADGTVISDTCVVTVLDAMPLTLDVPVEITVNAWGSYRMSFTPEASGWYQVDSGNAFYVDSLRDQDENYVNYYRDSFRATMYLEAGVEYTLRLYNRTELEQTETVVLSQVAELPLDGGIHVELTNNDYYFFTFTPEESGYYSATSSNTDINLQIMDGNSVIAYSDTYGGTRWSTAFLEAGKTYAVRAYHYYADSESADLGIRVAPTPESIGLNYETNDIGQVGDTYRVWVNFNPFYTRDIVTVTSSDESILAFTGMEGDYFLFEALAEGSVTLTATTAGGVTTTREITVKNPIVLELGVPASAEVGPEQRERFVLTAPANGWYVTRVVGNVGVECWYNSTKRSEDGEHFYYIWLSEGETYSVTAETMGEEAQSVTVEVRQAEEPASISLSAASVNFVDSNVEVRLDYGSYWAYADVNWTLTINGEEAWFNDHNNMTAHFYPTEVGTAVVVANVTKADGTVLSASITLDIIDTLPLELDVPVTITVADRSNFRVSFTPEVSGIYQVNHAERVYVNQVQANGEYFYNYSRSGNATRAYLEAGVEYTFYLFNYEWDPMTLDISVTNIDAPVVEQGVETDAAITLGGQIAYFTFVPATSGMYYFTSNANRDTYGYLYDGQMNQIASNDDGGNGNNFYIAQHLEAGETYILGIRYYSSEYTGLIPFVIDEAPAPTAVYVNYQFDGTGGVGDRYYFWINYEPWNAWDQVANMTSSDESILAFTEVSGDNWYFEAKAEGTVTVTVTTLKGLTASVEVTVKNPAPLTLGETVSFDMNSDEYAYFVINVEEEGYYGILATGGVNVWVDGDDRYQQSIVDGTEYGQHFVRAYLYEGENLVTVRNYVADEYGPFVRTINILADAVVPAETISLPETLYGFVDYGRTIYVDFGSVWNYSNVTWTVEQEGEVLGYGFGDYFIDLGFMAEGTATVTATTESGLSATMTVIVVDALELDLNREVEVTLSPNGSMIYKFIPDEDMLVTLEYGNLSFDGMWRTDEGRVVSAYNMFWLEAGVEYRVRFANWSDEEVSGTVYIGDPDELVKDVPVQAAASQQSYLIRPTVSDWYMIKIDQRNGYSAEVTMIVGEGMTDWVSGNSYSGDGYRYMVYYLEAGCEYIANCYPYNVDEYGQYTGNITLTDCVEPTSINIGMESSAVMVDGSTMWYVEFAPSYARDQITVTVEDPTIVQVNYEGGRNYRITGLAGGSTTVTFVTDGGLSVSRTVSVIQPEPLEEATVASGTLASEEYAYYQFVAPAEGLFAIRYPQNMDLLISGEFSTYDTKTYGGEVYRYIYAPAGENLMISLRNYNQAAAYELEWRTCEDPTALVVPEVINLVVDGSYRVDVRFGSPWEYSDGYLELVADNRGIQADGRWIYAYEPGTYTVTYLLHGEEGADPLTATSTVIVTEPQQIQLGQSYTMTLESSESSAVVFEVTEAGIYLIHRMQNVGWNLNLQTADGWMYLDYDYSFNSHRLYELIPGTYRIELNNNLSEQNTFDVTVRSTEALELYQDVAVQLASRDARIFSFTPAESGRYVFRVTDSNYSCSLLNSSLEPVTYTNRYDGNQRYIIAEMEAGETYYFTVYSYDGGASFALDVIESHQPESMEVAIESYNITNGYATVGDWLYVSAWFNPSYCLEDVTFTFSDETMVQVEHQGNEYLELSLLKAGQLTIYATSESGLDARVTINVVEPQKVELVLDQPQTITIAPNQAIELIYEMPDEEYGENYFLFYMTDADLRHKSLGYGGGGEYSRNVEGYYVKAQSWSLYDEIYFNFTGESVTIEVAVVTPVEPQQIVLNRDEMNLIVGSYGNVTHTFLPFNSWSEVEWTTSNPDVLEAWGMEGYGCELGAVSEGTAVVTVTTANGLSASCEVTVGYPAILGQLTLDEYVTHEMADVGDYAAYTFTAPETGTYFFAAMSNNDAYLSLYTTDWQMIAENDDYYRLHSGIWYPMEAGETVIVLGRPLDYGRIDTMTLVVSTHEGVYDAFVPGTALTLGEKVEFTAEGGYSQDFYFVPDTSGWYAIHSESAFGVYVAVEMYESGMYVNDQWLDPTGDSMVVYLEADVAYMIYIHSEEDGQVAIWIDDDASIPTRLEIITKPDRLTYVKDYVEFDLSGLVYKVTWADGSVTTHSYDEDGGWLDGFNLYADYYEDHNDGTATIYITINGICSASYDVQLIPNPVKDIEILYADQVPAFIEGGYGTLYGDGSFHYSTLLAARKIRFLVTYTDGTTEILSVEDTIEGCYFGAYSQLMGVGQENFIVFSILGHEARLDVEFAVNPVKSIEIVSGPNALVYGQDGRVSMDEEGNVYFEIDWANGYDGMSIRITYTDGTSQVISYADMTYLNTGEMIFDMPEYGGYPVDVTYYLPEYGAEFAYWMGGHMYPNEDGVIPMILHYMGHYVTFDLPVVDNNGTVTIVTQPQDVTATVGETVEFTVEAIGDGLTYQWQYNNGDGWKNSSNGNTATLKVEGSAHRDGYQYRCVIKDSHGNEVITNVVTLTIVELKITKQPENVKVHDGETVRVEIEATGENLTYQWYYAPAGETEFKKSSQTTAVYTTTMNEARDGYRLYCVVTDANGTSITSNTVVISMATVLEIVQQPTDAAVALGTNATFTVRANGDGLIYQWQYNKGDGWKNCTDGNTATLVIEGGAHRDGYRYRCVITDSYGDTVTTNAVTLDVYEPMSITKQPEDVFAADGEAVSVKVEATGEGLSYQWYYKPAGAADFIPSSNKTNTYTTTMNAVRNGYQIYCEITDAHGNSQITNVVTLTMVQNLVITQQPVNVTVVEGETAIFTVVATGEGLTYQWQYNAGSSWVNSSNGTTATLTVAGALHRNGYRYRCIITDERGNTVTTDVATLTVTPGVTIEITQQPESVTVVEGETATFTVVATGEGLTYQWQYNAGSSWVNSSNGTTATLTVVGALHRNGYRYRCVITDDRGNTVTTDVATLTVEEQITATIEITQQPENQTVTVGETATFTVVATGEGLSYQWQYNAGSSWVNSSNGTTATLTVVGALHRNGYRYRCVITDDRGNTVTTDVATLTVEEQITATIEITQQPENQIVAVGETATFTVAATGNGLSYQWQYNQGNGWKNSSNGTTATLTVVGATHRNGYQYRCIITDDSGNTVTTNVATLTVEEQTAATIEITKQPENQTVAVGETATFTVVATGNGLSYQWQYNAGSSWVNSSNGTTATLTVVGATHRNGYQYRCIITDDSGNTVTTNVATLTVEEQTTTAITITTHPANQTVAIDQTATFTVVATGEGLTYQWQYNQGNGWKNSSNGTTATLTVVGATHRNGYQYRCIITDANGNTVTSNVATLTVN